MPDKAYKKVDLRQKTPADCCSFKTFGHGIASSVRFFNGVLLRSSFNYDVQGKTVNPFDHSFGFKQVDPEEKTSLVKDVFKSVAKDYDLMNDLMSFGVHRLWKEELIKMLRPRSNVHLLDMAGGTGDIATRFLNASKSFENVEVTVADINEDMLKVGERRAVDNGLIKGIHWVLNDAASLSFPENSFDLYTISFGLRNVTHIDQALKEAYRVLKPGGMFYCLEFSKVSKSLLNKLYRFYSFEVIPKIGALVAKDKSAYQYLVESIDQFYSQEALVKMVESAGFQSVSYRNLSEGIAAIHSGIKI